MITASELKGIADKANDNSNKLLNDYLSYMEKEAKKGKYHLNIRYDNSDVEWYVIDAYNRLKSLGFKIGVNSREFNTENDFIDELAKYKKFTIEWF